MIELKNVSKRFGKLQVLRDVSLQCAAGECIALIGPNGCGKTTMIKSILGMTLPDSGEILFGGEPVAGQTRYRESIGYMPQIGSYPQNMTIGQVLSMIRAIRGNHARVDEDLVQAFHLNGMLDKRMGTLSGGTMQKVSAVLAFLFDPAVLILDEPTAGLDPIASETLRDKINSAREKNKLVLITSHVLSELDELITHLIYMQDGQIVFRKPVREFREETGEEKISRAIARYLKNSIL
jgi:Cu-processing system ATP-binding protein